MASIAFLPAFVAAPLISLAAFVCLALPSPAQEDGWEDLMRQADEQVVNRHFNDAESVYNSALSVAERFGESDPRLLQTLDIFGNFLASQDRPLEAESLLRRALEIRERAHGGDHPDLAGNLADLAYLYLNAGRLGDARSVALRGAAFSEQGSGPMPPIVAAVIDHIMLTYRERGLDEQERDFITQVIQIRRQALHDAVAILGDRDVNIARNAAETAHFELRMLSIKEADFLLTWALSIYQQEDSPKTEPWQAEALRRLAAVRQLEGRATEAYDLIQQAEAIARREHSPPPPIADSAPPP